MCAELDQQLVAVGARHDRVAPTREVARHVLDGLPLSDAVDFAPWITLRNGKKGIPWSDNNLFCLVAGIVLAAASIESVSITWGGDFDRDGSTEDQSLADLGHCQRTHAARRPRTIIT